MIDFERSQIPFSSQAIELSVEDYQSFIEPILRKNSESFFKQDVEEDDFIDFYCKKFDHYSKKTENSSEKEIYSLFKFILSFYFNPYDEKHPFDAGFKFANGTDTGLPTDIPLHHQDFLKGIVEKISCPFMRSRIADILYSIRKKDKRRNAELALDAYLIVSEKLAEKDLWAPIPTPYIKRALSLSKWLKNPEIHQNVIEKIQNFIKKKNFPFIAKIVLLLIGEKESNKDLLISILDDKARKENRIDDWAALKKVNHKMKRPKDVDFCKRRQSEIYEQQAEEADDPFHKEYWSLKSLETLPETQETKSQREKLNTHLSQASNDILKEMKLVRISLPEDCLTLIEKKSNEIKEKISEIKEKISGRSFHEVWPILLSYFTFPSRKKLEEEVEKEKSNLLGLFSPCIEYSSSSTVNSQDRSQCHRLESPDGQLSFFYTKRYFKSLTLLMFLPVLKGLEIIREEHKEIGEHDWRDLLSRSPLVPPENLRSFSKGFYDWFLAENCSALPTLIPQCENFIRFLIQQGGNNTGVYRNNEHRQEEDSFKKNLEHQIIKDTFGDDWLLQLKIFFLNEGNNGFNIGANIRHGLVNDSYYFDLKCEYIVFLILKVLIK